MSYVYRKCLLKSELFTVGFYGPDGKWESESDWKTTEAAAHRVHFLNGGTLQSGVPLSEAQTSVKAIKLPPGFYWLHDPKYSGDWTVGEVQADGTTVWVIGSNIDSDIINWLIGPRIEIPGALPSAPDRGKV
jgi:hypothetical protein